MAASVSLRERVGSSESDRGVAAQQQRQQRQQEQEPQGDGWLGWLPASMREMFVRGDAGQVQQQQQQQQQQQGHGLVSGGVLGAAARPGIGSQRMISLEEAQRMVEMADAALQAKTKAAERRVIQAASLGYQKGVAAASSGGELIQQAQQDLDKMRSQLEQTAAERSQLQDEVESLRAGGSVVGALSPGLTSSPAPTVASSTVSQFNAATLWQLSSSAAKSANDLSRREIVVLRGQYRRAVRTNTRLNTALVFSEWRDQWLETSRRRKLLRKVAARLSSKRSEFVFRAWRGMLLVRGAPNGSSGSTQVSQLMGRVAALTQELAAAKASSHAETGGGEAAAAAAAMTGERFREHLHKIQRELEAVRQERDQLRMQMNAAPAGGVASSDIHATPPPPPPGLARTLVRNAVVQTELGELPRMHGGDSAMNIDAVPREQHERALKDVQEAMQRQSVIFDVAMQKQTEALEASEAALAREQRRASSTGEDHKRELAARFRAEGATQVTKFKASIRQELLDIKARMEGGVIGFGGVASALGKLCHSLQAPDRTIHGAQSSPTGQPMHPAANGSRARGTHSRSESQASLASASSARSAESPGSSRPPSPSTGKLGVGGMVIVAQLVMRGWSQNDATEAMRQVGGTSMEAAEVWLRRHKRG